MPDRSDQFVEIVDTQAGTYYALVRCTQDYALDDSYSLRADTATSLSSLAPGIEETGDLGKSDFDIYQLTPGAGQHLIVQLDGAESTDTYELYIRYGSAPDPDDPAGYDDAGNVPDRSDQFVEIVDTQAGTYYALVRCTQDYALDDSYSLRADTATSLSSLAPGIEEIGDLGKSDFDIYQLNPGAGQHLVIQLDGANDLDDLELYVRRDAVPFPDDPPVYDVAGIVPDQSDQVAEITETQSGTYFVLVRCTHGVGANAAYSLRVDAASSVPEIPLGGEVVGSLSNQGDSALYRIEVAGGEYVTLTLDSGCSLAENELYAAYDRIPTREDYDFIATEPNQADQVLNIPGTQSGTYFVQAYAIYNPLGQDYTLRADTGSTIPEIPLGGELTGTLVNTGDMALYRVEVDAGEQLTFTLDSDSTYAENELYVSYGVVPSRSSYDFAAAEPDQADQVLNIAGTQAGTYYVLAHAGYNPLGQGYALRADLGSTIATIPMGGEVTGTLEGSGDFHIYRIGLFAEQEISLALTSDSTRPTNELYLRYDTLPRRVDGGYDFVAAESDSASQIVNIVAPQTGTYYVLVYAADNPFGQDYSVSVTQESVGGVWHEPSGLVTAPVDSLRVFFRYAIDPSRFSPEDDLTLTGPQGAIPITSHSWPETDELEVQFAPQSIAGAYALVVGPEIVDTSGNAMDLNLNGVRGEIPEDQYEGSFVFPGPRVVGHEAIGPNPSVVDTIVYHFGTAVDPATFVPGDDLSGPLSGVTYSWPDTQTLELKFDALTTTGSYEVLLGPEIHDPWGNSMDQDGDLIPGELDEDRYVTEIEIQYPQITRTYPAETVAAPFETLRISFDTSMDKDSFSAEDIQTFAAPDGTQIELTDWSWLGSRTLDLSFPPQSATGLYHLEIGSQILDAGGNPMSGLYATTLALPQSGNIEEDTTWSPAQGVVVVGGDLSIENGVILTIEPGTIVKFADDARISNHGTLLVRGTIAEPAVFTAIQDDTVGGDTNGDGDATDPDAGSWRGMRFFDASDATLENIDIRYADKAIHGMGASTIRLENARLHNNEFGIYVYTPYVDITAQNCLISDNSLTGVFLRADSRAVLRNCTIVANGMEDSGRDGAGIHLGGAALTLENSIVAFNNTELHHDGDAPQVSLERSIFYNPEPGRILLWNDWRSDPPSLEANGCMIADPGFIQPSLGNYELGVDSPAVDAGDGTDAPSTDLLGQPRYDDPNVVNTGSGIPGYVDLGALERQLSSRATDLAVIDVQNPSAVVAAPGDPLSISWSVANMGEFHLAKSWVDAVYLSVDTHLDPGEDRLLGKVEHTGGLAAGDTYDSIWNGVVPDDVAGPQYLLVATNDGNAFPESSRSNNVRTSQVPINVSADVLVLGSSQSDTLREDHWRFYQFEALAGQDVRFAVDASSGAGMTELYVRRGAAPTFSQYDAAGLVEGQPDQEVQMLDLMAGTYYVGIFASELPSGSTAFDLSASPLAFELEQVTPGQVGNAGRATIEISGKGLTRHTEVELVAPDGTIIEGDEWFQDSSTLFATFDLAAAGAPAGAYDVVVVNPGPVSVVQDDILTVVSGGIAELQADLVVPDLARPGRTVEIQIEYANTGQIDLASPLFTIASIEELTWTTEVQWNRQSMILRAPTDLQEVHTERVAVDSISLLGISDDGPAAILRPGQSLSLAVEVTTPFHTGDLPFELYVFGQIGDEGLTEPIDWEQLGADIRPTDTTDDAWDPLFARLKAQVGTTWGSYLDVLRDNAEHLAEIDQRVHDAAELFSFEFVQAASMGTTGHLDAQQDAYCSAPGLPLSFVRLFLPSPSYRARLGVLGRGWTHSYDIVLDQRSDERIVINGPDGLDRTFDSDGNSGYAASPGDTGTLTAEVGGEFLLTEMNGLEIHFRSDGRFDWIEEPNGNRITASYDAGGNLTEVTHTNGDRFAFTYNVHDRLASITDHNDQVTSFAYDGSGEHLMSVTYPDGRQTTYTYITGEGLLRDHDLASVSPPGSAVVSFAYDELGRLSESHLAAGEESVSYSYSTAGKTLAEDALGNTTAIWLDSRGRTTMTEDPLGYRNWMTYDAISNLTAVTGPRGYTSSFTYDDRGNLLSSQDAMGYVTEFGYGGTYSEMLWFRDARGNVTDYSYDAAGNLASITYPDGTVESWAYDASGNVESWTNRRGSAVDYTSNSSGQLTQKDYEDGTGVTYTYDTMGWLETATGPEGTTTFHRDSYTGRLDKIDYPEGRYLEFHYDTADRRTQMVDHEGFTVNYSYDSAGRLEQLTDGEGANIVTYTYDDAGRLTREDKGNGTYTTYIYDAAGQILSLINHAPDGTAQSYFHYTYDPLGRRVATDTHYGTWTYENDASGQLIHAVLDSTDAEIPDQDLTYIYDPLGNRISTIINGVTTNYTTNNMNQYTQVGEFTYQHDADGNLIGKTDGSETWTYVYNDENRLVGVVGPDGTWEYEYDVLGNRVATVENGVRTEYLVDPQGLGDVIGEYAGRETLVSKFVSGLGLVSQVDAAITETNGYAALAVYYSFDALGSTSQLTSATEGVASNLTWSPFGIALRADADEPFGYVGRFGVMQETNGFEFMRARFCDANLGRFLSRDPFGIAAGDINLYRYVGNGVTTWIDPSGRLRWPDTWGTEVGAEAGIGYDSDADEFASPGYQMGLSWVTSDSQNPDNVGQYMYGGPLEGALTFGASTSTFAAWSNKPGAEWTGNFKTLNFSLGGISVGWFWNDEWFGFSYGAGIGFPWGFSFGDAEYTRIGASATPEDKLGPAGYDAPGTPAGSESRFITAQTTVPLDYRIEFWNEPTAVVSTQDAIIEDVLDPAVFDLSTFEFTRFGFLDWDIHLPAGTTAIDQVVDMRPTFDLMVRVEGAFDATTGEGRMVLPLLRSRHGRLPRRSDARVPAALRSGDEIRTGLGRDRCGPEGRPAHGHAD